MWLTRFHLIEPRDYNRISRMCERSGFVAKKFSPLLLAKGIVLHTFSKKPWRRVATELGVPHIPIYHLYQELESSGDLHTLLIYFIERRIVLFVESERHITREMLATEDIISGSLLELGKMFEVIEL